MRDILSILAFVSCLAACYALTRQQADMGYAIDVAACDGLKSIPVVGMVAAMVCPAEEAIAKAALDADVAAHPPATALPVPSAVAAAIVKPLVTRRARNGRRMHVGYFPPERAARCQAWIDAHAASDAGATDADMWHPEVVATSMPDAVSQ